MVNDTIEDLDFIDPKVFKASFTRPNISYHVINTEDKNYQLEHLLKQYKGSSIIYVRNRKATIDISNYLDAKGFAVYVLSWRITNTEKTRTS